MKFKVGSRVKMKRTDNVGTVSAVLPGGLFQVRLDGGMGELPIPGEVLESADRIVEVASHPTNPPLRSADSSDDAGKEDHDTGLHFVFDPIYDNEDQPEAYRLYLINGTRHKLVYEVKVHTGDSKRHNKMGQLAAYDRTLLDGTVPYAWLNERLSVEFDVRTLKLEGTGPRNHHILRIKGKQFFANFREVPEMNREAHLFTVFPRLALHTDTAPASPPQPTLQQLTKEQLAKKPKEPLDKRLVQLSLQDRAEFEETIDRHLPALVKNPSGVPKHQVLATQLKYFDEYIDQALRLGVDSVFVIHGVGNGVLKRAIHKRLRYVPFVRKYKNEWHDKYGFGATEVIFD